MFGYVRSLLFKRDELSPAGSPHVERTEIKTVAYNSDLIMSLEADHKVLLSSYVRIMKYARNKQYAKLTLELNDFSDILKAHLRKEEHSLYMYLEFVLGDKNKKRHREEFRDLHLEMKSIAKAVTTGISKYTNIPVTNLTIEQFIIDFTVLGSVLSKRIKKEEDKLYPIYLSNKS